MHESESRTVQVGMKHFFTPSGQFSSSVHQFKNLWPTWVAFCKGTKYHPHCLLCKSPLFACSWPPLMQPGLNSSYTCSFVSVISILTIIIHKQSTLFACLPAEEVIRWGTRWFLCSELRQFTCRLRLRQFTTIFKKTIAKSYCEI